ncbi:uncharacterized protein LOC144918407 [Branchiostoma floridae x Branchiostoma belcheri]
MLRMCERLREADSVRRNHGPARAETGYLRALVDAMADMDRWAEVELLKSLGDVNLELGKLDRDVGKFGRAKKLYVSARVRCQDPEVGLTLEHRYNYAEKLATRRRVKHPTFKTDIVKGTGTSSPENLAQRFEELDKNLVAGDSIDAAIVGYTRLMVEGIIAEDSRLEAEAIKSLGDAYLKRGRETRDTTCLTKASALYHTALARWEGGQGRDVLVHRLLYTAKVRQDVNTTFTTSIKRHGIEDKRGQQNFQLPRDILTSHGDAETRGLYSGYLRIADDILRRGHLDLVEEVFAFALRLIHDPSKPALPDEAHCLSRLGDVYTRKGQSTKEGKKFTQAAALYNAAIARTDDPNNRQNLVGKLQEAERLFLQHVVGSDSHASLCNNTEAHREKLETVRSYAKSQLEVIDEKYNPYRYEEDDPVVKEVEVQRAEAVEKLFQYISRERQEFVQRLLEECMEKLGPPPCKYAYIGLGSQATELVTPYSDLEFAILIEEGKDDDDTRRYFLNLTHYLHLKVINLGETILPAMAIKSLNDFYSEDPERDWFYDSVTPRGFAFDGFMPWACKTPFGREQTKSKPALSLIQTPTKMAEFQRKDEFHLPDVLRRVVLLTGDQMLVDQYVNKVHKIVAMSPHSCLFTASVLKQGIPDIRIRQPLGQLVDVKKEIYRFPSLAIETLRLGYGITSASAWSAIDELGRIPQVSEENVKHLKVLTGISAELRLRTYLANGGQKESLSPLAEMKEARDIPDTIMKSVFHVPDIKMLFRYYYTAIPFRRLVLDVDNSESDHDKKAALSERRMFDNSPLYRGIVAQKFLKFVIAISSFEAALKTAGSDQAKHAAILLQLAESWMLCGDSEKAIGYLEQSLGLHQSVYGDSTAHPGTAMALSDLGTYWSRLGQERKAITYYKQSLMMYIAVYGKNAVHPDIAGTIHNLGGSCSALGDQTKAIRYFEDSLKMLKGIHGDKTHHDIASTLNNIGLSWSSLGDHRRAINYYEESLIMRQAIYGDCAAHPDIAESLNNLGSARNALGDRQKAYNYHVKALQMYKVIYGNNTPHPNIAGLLHNLGVYHSSLDNERKAISYYEQSLKMQTAIHEGNAAHPDIANTLNNLGMCWCALGDKKKAHQCHEEALTMRQAIYGENTPHPAIASSLYNLGLSWSILGDHRKATSYLEKSLRMMKIIYGKNTPHPNIYKVLTNLGLSWRALDNQRKAFSCYEQSLRLSKAIHANKAHPETAMSLYNLGVSWSALGDEAKAIDYFEQSVKMLKTIHGHNTAHPDIATALRDLGDSWRELGDEQKAAVNTEESLMMLQTIYGDNTAHKDIAGALHNLGISCSRLGDETKAIRYYEQSLKMKKTIYGQNTPHPHIAASMGSLGASWSALGNVRTAIFYYEESLKMKRALYGENPPHPDVAATLYNLGESWSKLEDHGKAISCYEESLRMLQAIHGHSVPNPYTYLLLKKLGEAWSKVGNEKKAVSYYGQATRMKKAMYGDIS